jgi:hypothetical protein
MLIWAAFFVVLAALGWFGWQAMLPKPAAVAVPAAQSEPAAGDEAAPADSAAASESPSSEGGVYPVF